MYMIAVIETGSKQYLIKEGDVIKVEKLEAEPGTDITFDKVLLLAEEDGSNVQIGNPYIEGASIVAHVEEQGRAKKIRVVKYKRKVRYRRVIGHKQYQTKLKVKKVA